MVYNFPELSEEQILENGTENEYTSLNFSQDGEKLATIGGEPDYWLSVWDWHNKKIILKCKAFSQLVMNVKFNTDPSSIATSGVGHIKFWKMEDTFTGLKLQGEIGKFGNVELSDITCFSFLDDGKVLTGSESGSLLLWEGNFIKLEFRIRNELNEESNTDTSSSLDLPHNGAILVVQRVKKGNQSVSEFFITSARDHKIKFWNYIDVEEADIPENEDYATLTPRRVIDLSQSEAIVNSLVYFEPLSDGQEDEGTMICNDSNGTLLQLHVGEKASSAKKLQLDQNLLTHAYAVTDAILVGNFVVSASKDGTMQIYCTTFNKKVQNPFL